MSYTPPTTEQLFVLNHIARIDARDMIKDEELFGGGRCIGHGPGTLLVNIVARAL